MATPFSSTTPIRPVFRPQQGPPKALLSIRGADCGNFRSSRANVYSLKSAANYVRIELFAALVSTRPLLDGNLVQNRSGAVKAATIEEIEAQKTLIEKDVKARMEKTMQTVLSNFNSRTGRASASMLDKIEIVGGKASKLYGDFNFKGPSNGDQVENDWVDFESDLHYWTNTLRPVQWYPGHIAKTEKELKEQLKLMDVVIEVRDARIPLSTSHPQMDAWLGNRRRILVLNREDMISSADRNAWATYFTRKGMKVVFANGKLGMGAMKLGRLAKTLASDVNIKRRAKGLLPRPVRAGIVGYPNVGKSSLINRLLKRRMCPAAPRPGVTRELKWVRFGNDLELLDSPGIIPMRISDQTAAIKLAICDDIGEKSYDAADVAAILVQILTKLPSVGIETLQNRYKIDVDGQCGDIFVQKLAVALFNGDSHQAAFRILSDFRKGRFGWISLERPPR